MIFLNRKTCLMIKEKYKQLCLHRLFGGVNVIDIHLRYATLEK